MATDLVARGLVSGEFNWYAHREYRAELVLTFASQEIPD